MNDAEQYLERSMEYPEVFYFAKPGSLTNYCIKTDTEIRTLNKKLGILWN